MLITQGASSNSIGGTVTGAGNTIAFNLDNGVDVVGATTTGNSILSNLIFGNGLLGIDLGDDGVTPDHATATAGPNDFQNFPVITSVVSSGTSPIIGGTLNSVANTSFLVQFYSNPVAPASGYGQGETLLGSATVITDANGSATFTATVSGSLSLGNVVSATATNLSTGDTSEFSLDFSYQLTTEFSAAAYTVSETGGTATITVTRSSGSSTSASQLCHRRRHGGAGVNYTPASGTLVFSAGQTSQSFTIPIIHDFEITGPLTVGIALSSPTKGFLGTPSTAVLTINDVDQPGALAFGSSTVIADPGATVANVTVLRVGVSGGRSRWPTPPAGAPPSPGTDYTSVSGVLTFKPGETSATIAVPILNSTPGSNKTFSVVLSSPTGGATLGTPATVTITIAPPGAQDLPLVVTNTNDSGPGSLRQAILDANTNGSGPNDIQFAIPASTSPLLNIPVAGIRSDHSNLVDQPGQSASPDHQSGQYRWVFPGAFPGAVPVSERDLIGDSIRRHRGYGRHLHAHHGGTATGRDHGTYPVQRHAGHDPGRPRSAILGSGNVSVTGTYGLSGLTASITFTGAYASQDDSGSYPRPIGSGKYYQIVQLTTTTVGGVPKADPTEISSDPQFGKRAEWQ